jgi:LEA14-like dessication related protein
LRALHLLPAVLLATIGGCSMFWDSPSVRIADVRVSGIGLSGARADITLEVVNPNGFSLTSKALRYRLEFEDPEVRAAGDDDPWRTVAEGAAEQVVALERNDTTRVTVGVPFRYRDLGDAALTLIRDGRLRYRLAGDIVFDAPIGDVRVPFNDTGEVGL